MNNQPTTENQTCPSCGGIKSRGRKCWCWFAPITSKEEAREIALRVRKRDQAGPHLTPREIEVAAHKALRKSCRTVDEERTLESALRHLREAAIILDDWSSGFTGEEGDICDAITREGDLIEVICANERGTAWSDTKTDLPVEPIYFKFKRGRHGRRG